MKRKPYFREIMSPVENFLVKELQEAGSETMITLIAALSNRDIVSRENTLREFAVAVRNLTKRELIYPARPDNTFTPPVYQSLDREDLRQMLDYLTECPFDTWYYHYEYGDYGEIEIILTTQM